MMTGPSVAVTPSSRSSLLQRLGLDRPELRAWAMYYWANSAFQATIVTAIIHTPDDTPGSS